MADLEPTKTNPQWKYTADGTEGFVHVEMLPDGTLDWIAPSNPSPELIQKVMDKAVADGYTNFKVQTVPTDTMTMQNATGQTPTQNANQQKIMQPLPDPKTFEGRINAYLPEEYKNMKFSEIPAEAIHSAWDTYSKDWAKGVSSLGINDKRAQRLMNIANIYEGNGPYFSQFQTFFACLDRYGNNIMLTNVENTGVTFITRPRLCLQSTNLRSQRRMTVLDTSNTNTIAFAIRALLDTNLDFNGKYTDQLMNCPLVDIYNPFFTPLCNALTSLSGLPDISIVSDQTDGGYMCEGQQYAVGGDDLSRGNYQLTLDFKDIQGGIISSIFYFWLEYIRCVTRGLMLAYPDDIDEQCLNYTVSIYHFNLDPTGNYITDWVKCTGCYPTSMPIGAKLQVNEGEFMNRAADKVTVNFICNKVEYRDYAIFMDFDTLMRRYCPDINQTFDGTEFQPGPAEGNSIITTASRYGNETKHLIHPSLPRSAWANFRGLPWITSDARGPKLEYRCVSNPVYNHDDYLGVHEDTDIADQLIKMDVARQIRNQEETKEFAKANYPEYLEAAEKYQINDLKEFVQRVFRQEIDPFNNQKITGTKASVPINNAATNAKNGPQ